MRFSDDLGEQASGNVLEYDESGELIPPKPAEGPWKAVTPSQPAPPSPAQPPPQAGKKQYLLWLLLLYLNRFLASLLLNC